MSNIEYKVIEQNYSPAGDITYIMQATYVNDELKELECVGWYSGEPMEYEYYKNYIGRNKAVYNL